MSMSRRLSPLPPFGQGQGLGQGQGQGQGQTFLIKDFYGQGQTFAARTLGLVSTYPLLTPDKVEQKSAFGIFAQGVAQVRGEDEQNGQCIERIDLEDHHEQVDPDAEQHNKPYVTMNG